MRPENSDKDSHSHLIMTKTSFVSDLLKWINISRRLKEKVSVLQAASLQAVAKKGIEDGRRVAENKADCEECRLRPIAG